MEPPAVRYPILVYLGFGTIAVPDHRLALAYKTKGKLEEFVLIHEALVKQSPKDSNRRLELASAYVDVGDFQKAIEQLEIAIEINPEAEKEIRNFIQEISSQ